MDSISIFCKYRKHVEDMMKDELSIGRMIKVEADYSHIPKKANMTDAAYDLYTSKAVEAKPYKRMYIPLGFKIELPKNMAMLIQPRSGQSGKGMLAYAFFPKWLSWITGVPVKVRINADVILGLVDSNYGGEVNAIVKFGKFRLKHRIMRLLGFKIIIVKESRICQGRLVTLPPAVLTYGKVTGTRNGLGSTDM